MNRRWVPGEGWRGDTAGGPYAPAEEPVTGRAAWLGAEEWQEEPDQRRSRWALSGKALREGYGRPRGKK